MSNCTEFIGLVGRCLPWLSPGTASPVGHFKSTLQWFILPRELTCSRGKEALLGVGCLVALGAVRMCRWRVPAQAGVVAVPVPRHEARGGGGGCLVPVGGPELGRALALPQLGEGGLHALQVSDCPFPKLDEASALVRASPGMSGRVFSVLNSGKIV